MGILLALGSAVFYGLADFVGGLLSRRMHFARVALMGQLGGLAATVPAAVAFGATTVRPADLLWGALSGIGTGVGMLFLYRAMSRTVMSVAVPVSAVTGVALPVLVGVLIMGDRPSVLAWVGVLISVPALWLVSRSPMDTTSRGRQFPLDALLAGVGIAAQYLALSYPEPAAGLWPLVVGRVAACVTVAPLFLAMRPASTSGAGRWSTPAALATGVLPALALAFFMLATREQLLTIAVVVSSLYPVIPVVLGVALLHERPIRTQLLGLITAGAAVLLIMVG